MNQEAEGAGQPAQPVDLVGYYNRLLRSRDVSPFAAVPEGPPDLSDPVIEEIIISAGMDLNRIVEKELGNRPELRGIVDEMVDTGDESLRALRHGDEPRLRDNPGLVRNLELIVKASGRPSFLIRDGKVARSTSPLGSWGPTLDSEADRLREAVACVGRIDDPLAPLGSRGTGFLVHADLILTNRHVLQAFATQQANGSWQMEEGITIDFGHEHQGQPSVNPRELKRVVYAGPDKTFAGDSEPTKLDLALIELAPGQAAAPTPLAVELSAAWPAPDTTIFVIGYPLTPLGEADAVTLFEKLFQSLIGYKRLAPGRVMPSRAQAAPWTVAHDATTIFGNSGSVVLAIGRETVAAALHFGGVDNPSLENWGHNLSLVLDEPGAGSDKTLRQHFTEYGVSMVSSPV